MQKTIAQFDGEFLAVHGLMASFHETTSEGGGT